jgi:predicted RNA-binding Zn ribbon-like protein
MKDMTITTAPDCEASGAPGELELVRQFVNSHDYETGAEELSSPTALSRWLAERGLGAPSARLRDGDLERAIELREALREALLTNNTEPLPPTTVARLNDALAGVSLEVRVNEDCTIDLEPGGRGLDAALASIASIIREAMLSGEWARLKVCPADDCLWAFYDRSRNRSRTWCRMDECGNRAKVRAFRERHSH